MLKGSFIYFLIVITSALSSNAQSHYPVVNMPVNLTLEDKLVPKLYSFDLQDVKLLNSRFKQNMEREQEWLMSIGKRLLHSFRTNAGDSVRRKAVMMLALNLLAGESLDCELGDILLATFYQDLL